MNVVWGGGGKSAAQAVLLASDRTPETCFRAYISGDKLGYNTFYRFNIKPGDFLYCFHRQPLGHGV